MMKITEGRLIFYCILIEKTFLRFLEILSQSHCTGIFMIVNMKITHSYVMVDKGNTMIVDQH